MDVKRRCVLIEVKQGPACCFFSPYQLSPRFDQQKPELKQKIPRLNVGKFQLQELGELRDVKLLEFKRKDKPAIWLVAGLS